MKREIIGSQSMFLTWAVGYFYQQRYENNVGEEEIRQEIISRLNNAIICPTSAVEDSMDIARFMHEERVAIADITVYPFHVYKDMADIWLDAVAIAKEDGRYFLRRNKDHDETFTGKCVEFFKSHHYQPVGLHPSAGGWDAADYFIATKYDPSEYLVYDETF